MAERERVIPTLGVNNFKPTKSASGAQADLCIVQTPITGDASPSFGGTTYGMAVLAFYAQLGTQGSGIGGHGVTPSMKMENTMAVACVTGDITHALTHEGADASEDGTGRGTPIVADAVLCLASGQANAEVVRDGVPTLNTIHEQPIVTGAASAGRPRRLTPLECERLMGWPDRHTAQGIREDGTAYALSDTARYRLCGNGVGTPVAAWIGRRLAGANTL